MTWADDNYEHKKLITIDKDLVAGDETDFTVLVSISDSDLTDCLANGYDIKFYNADEDTQLKHERQAWDNTDGSLIAWVKVDSLSSTSDTLIYMYYEYADEDTDQADPENAWDSNFMMVQHMIDTTTGTITDSTSNDNDGAKLGANEPITTTSGKIGNAQDFDGDDEYINIGIDDTLKGTPFALEAWFKPAVTYPGEETKIERHLFSKDISRPRGYLKLATGEFLWSIYDGTDALSVESGNESWTGGTFYHFVCTHGAGSMELFIDGVSNEARDQDTFQERDNDWLIGARSDGYGFYGVIDEFRIHDSARSANWISTNYETMDDPDAFMSFGDEESPLIVPVALTTRHVHKLGLPTPQKVGIGM